MKPPTDKQREALRALADGPLSSGAFASTTVHVLCLQGWAKRVHETDAWGRRYTMLVRTPAGAAVLEAP